MRAIVFSTVMFCAVGAEARITMPSPADKAIDAGTTKLEAGDVAGALEAFDRAAKLEPKNPRPRYLRGAALQKKGDLEGAVAAFRAALAIDPKLAEVHNELGLVLTLMWPVAIFMRVLRGMSAAAD